MIQQRNVYACVTEDDQLYTKGSGPIMVYLIKELAIEAMERTGAPKVRKYTMDFQGNLIKTEDFYPQTRE
jgi:hypothetical protein